MPRCPPHLPFANNIFSVVNVKYGRSLKNAASPALCWNSLLAPLFSPRAVCGVRRSPVPGAPRDLRAAAAAEVRSGRFPVPPARPPARSRRAAPPSRGASAVATPATALPPGPAARGGGAPGRQPAGGQRGRGAEGGPYLRGPGRCEVSALGEVRPAQLRAGGRKLPCAACAGQRSAFAASLPALVCLGGTRRGLGSGFSYSFFCLFCFPFFTFLTFFLTVPCLSGVGSR